jgi:uncharacterized membrane-anchored protein YitT (DUF2179 family)
MMSVTPIKITDGTDKNGDSFNRIIFEQDKELNGVKYKAQSVIMVFSDAIAQLETVKLGQKIKLIVNKGDYKGRESYQLLAVVK